MKEEGAQFIIRHECVLTHIRINNTHVGSVFRRERHGREAFVAVE